MPINPHQWTVRKVAHPPVACGLWCLYCDLKFTTPPMNLHTATRAAVRATLIQNGPQTCSDIVRGMGMDPRRHKGTVHAIMVEMEREGILDATRADNGKRDLWFIVPTAIRKRDRLIAAMFG